MTFISCTHVHSTAVLNGLDRVPFLPNLLMNLHQCCSDLSPNVYGIIFMTSEMLIKAGDLTSLMP